MGKQYIFDENKRFINPYNFVKVDLNSETKAPSTEGEKLHTGVLNCRLITRTPLAVPDIEGIQNEIIGRDKHIKYKFFNYGGKKVIPGSTLRGSIRNIYEVITDSCFVTSKSDEIITVRDNKKGEAGVLLRNEDGVWELYDANRKNKIHTKKNGAKAIKVKNMEKAMKELDAVYRDYNNESINKKLEKGKSVYGWYKKAKEAGSISVWYGYANGDIKLSLASIGRKAYKYTMGDMVKNKMACKDRNDPCAACRLFGMAQKNNSLGSKIRVTDAVCISKNVKTEFKTLKELSSPRITYEPFYSEVGGEIRGRKFYWHDTSKVTIEKLPEVKPNKRNATMELVESGIEFAFKVFYNSVSEKELSDLIWTLTLGENTDESKYCYKIGHGKPLGLGSAKIVIDSYEERNLETNGIYNIVVTEKNNISIITKDLEANGGVLKSLMIMCKFEEAETDINYPYVEKRPENIPVRDNEVAAHQWFKRFWGKDKISTGKSDTKPENKLPYCTDQNVSLPVLVLDLNKK